MDVSIESDADLSLLAALEGELEGTEIGSVGGGVSEWAAGPGLSGLTSISLPATLANAHRDPVKLPHLVFVLGADFDCFDAGIVEESPFILFAPHEVM